MRPSEPLARHRTTIREVVAAHRAGNPRVFGSVVHGEDTEDSDLDLLVDPQEQMSLFDLGAIIADLNELLGIRVDVATPAALPESMRQRVLRDAVPV
ncbi:MAG: nucleotidyltransferase family protein [Acetobacteraceae bacterium]|jgi:predicted nucleotidyltransferase